MKLFFILILLCGFSKHGHSINKDSLWGVWSDETKEDTIRFLALHKFTFNGYLFSQPDSAYYFAQIGYAAAEKANSLKYMGVNTNTMGIAQSILGNNPQALDYFKEAMNIYLQIGNLKGVSASYNNMGIIYKDQGDFIRAIDVYSKSYKLSQYINDRKGEASALNNLGIIYHSLKEYDKSIENYNLVLQISVELNDEKGISSCLNNIGLAFYSKGDYDKALDYYFQSLSYKDTINYNQSLSIAYGNIGTIYRDKNNFEKALDYYNKSLKIKEQLKNKKGITISLNSIAVVYRKQEQYEKSISYGTRSLKLANETGVVLEIQNVAFNLYQTYKKLDDTENALEMYELYILMRDSLVNSDNQKAILQKEFQFQYEKEKAIADKETERIIAVSEKDREKQKVISISIGVGLVLMIFFLIFVFNRLKITKQKNNIIEKQKHQVDTALTILEEKNKEITDSIQYAKRIQSAILPPLKEVQKYLPHSFVLYKPKDIVAGDFYWMEHKQNKILFAAADCTGHGVPGAMVSVICNGGLNRSVREYGLTDPADILNKTREIVISEFEKSEEDVKDGMDIALCSLEGNVLKYAGANNPLWIVRENEITETKADKQPIGKFEKSKPFTTHSFELLKGDTVYIFSDGFVDQFGGEKGKKFKPKLFRELLLSIQDKNMEEQKQIIGDVFEKWKGNIEQIDDICIIGVRM